MVLLYMVTWIPSIYPLYVSINIPAPWIRHGYDIISTSGNSLTSGPPRILAVCQTLVQEACLEPPGEGVRNDEELSSNS